jgi:hypothetical protein
MKELRFSNLFIYATIPFVDWNYGNPTHDIDVWTDVFINTTENKDGSSILSLKGSIAGDGFPISEAFVSDDFGTSIFLGTGAAKGGPITGPTLDLARENEVDVSINVNLRINVNADGVFQSVIQGDKTISIGDWNK